MPGKMIKLEDLVKIRDKMRDDKKTVVFTNGVFDILHRGHVEYLTDAKALGDVLVLGLNSDASVKRLKGAARPIVNERDRAGVLTGLSAVDYLCLFEEDTPAQLIKALIPDILVKGGDYKPEQIVGRETVENNGGKVVTIPLTQGKSTTNIVQKIIELVKEGLIAE